MSDKTKISIIVPVYNSAKYLAKCLDSLIYQTYSNLEIICINDGSTDNSLDILNQYAKKDSRISVYSQNNCGQSAARNFGTEIATGDYISFIDSDDWVYLTLYQTFINTLNKAGREIDIYMFNVGSYVEGKNDIIPLRFLKVSDWNNHKSDDTIHIFDDCKKPFSRNLSAENKIYRRAFLKDIGLIFPTGLKFEDQYFSIKAFLHAKSIIFTQAIMLRYRNYFSGSLTTSVSEKAFDIFSILDLVENEIFALNQYESYKYALFQYKYNTFVAQYYMCPEDLKQKYFDEMKSRLVKAEGQNLDKNIYVQLRNYKLFEVIKNSNRDQFDKFIKAIGK